LKRLLPTQAERLLIVVVFLLAIYMKLQFDNDGSESYFKISFIIMIIPLQDSKKTIF